MQKDHNTFNNFDNNAYNNTYNIGSLLSTKDSLDALLVHAVNHEASDVFFRSNDFIKIFRHGRILNISHRKISDSEINLILKNIHSDVAQAELGSMQPIDTSYHVALTRSSALRFRVHAIHAEHGCTITLRAIPEITPTTKELGVEDNIIKACKRKYGLRFITGATGNGKSTLLAALIRGALEDCDAHHNIITIENPVEFTYHKLTSHSITSQLQVGRDVRSFKDGIRASLRMAPTILLVGESRDFETFSTTINAAKAGYGGVYTTLHSTNIKQTFYRIIEMFPMELRNQLKSELIDLTEIIVSQRLIPTLDQRRTAIREFLVFDPQIRDKLRESSNIVSCINSLTKTHGQPFELGLSCLLKNKLISKKTFTEYGGEIS